MLKIPHGVFMVTNVDDYGRAFLIAWAKSISGDLEANDFEKSVDTMDQIADLCIAEHLPRMPS